MKIFVLYRLREGASFDDYRRWSLEADQPTLRSFSQVTDFGVYQAAAAPGSTAAHTIVEVIEVESAEAWSGVAGSAAVKALQPDFERYVDPDSLCILHSEEIAG